jgi:hypothetical protein
MAVFTDVMYCCSVWFWAANGTAAMTRRNCNGTVLSDLRELGSGIYTSRYQRVRGIGKLTSASHNHS